MVDAGTDRDATKAYGKKNDERHHQEKLKEFNNEFKDYKPIEPSASNFHHHGIDALRAMIANANPGALETAGNHWRASADELGGADGTGGIRKAFMEAVDHASAHWQGKAADAFRREAVKILKKLDLTYLHARNAEQMLIGTVKSGPKAGVAYNLRKAQETMSKIEDPGVLERIFDAHDDDSQFHKDMANPKMDARMALEANRNQLSLSKERQVEAVIVMEELASHYRAHQGNVTLGDAGWPGSSPDWPSKPAQPTAVPPVNMPIPGGGGPKGTATVPQAPKGGGVGSAPHGFGGATVKSPTSGAMRPGVPGVHGGSVVSGGTGLHGGVGMPGARVGGVGGGGRPVPRGDEDGGGRVTPAEIPSGSLPPVPPGPIGGSKSPMGGSGRRDRATGDAIGAGGMVPGVPGGVSGGGRAVGGRGTIGGGVPVGGAPVGGGSIAGRPGATVRTPGGVVGAPGSPSAPGGSQGGSGLHRSRGGAQGVPTGQPGMGSPGMPGARGNQDKDRETKQRPDYLVEDEETWAPQRDVAPRVIE
ncbi:hypothetical protein [Streptomyces sp. NPDC003077]|uniref:hypothetical protein n=1 Tax=Streptomyces sp. NPDC003077 TaxID=3154443 RepID=UPI0033BB0304